MKEYVQGQKVAVDFEHWPDQEVLDELQRRYMDPERGGWNFEFHSNEKYDKEEEHGIVIVLS